MPGESLDTSIVSTIDNDSPTRLPLDIDVEDDLRPLSVSTLELILSEFNLTHSFTLRRSDSSAGSHRKAPPGCFTLLLITEDDPQCNPLYENHP